MFNRIPSRMRQTSESMEPPYTPPASTSHQFFANIEDGDNALT